MYCDDSDIKIVPDRPSEIFDTSEGAAVAFVREKNNGNMEKARILGTRFAEALFSDDRKGIAFGIGEMDDANTIAQRKVMFTHVVGQVIEDIAPNSIVAQSALSAFYDRIQQDSAEIYDQVTETAAVTMYMLASRTTADDPQAYGGVFARLCGQEGNPLFVQYGSELANYFKLFCTHMALKIEWIR